MSARFSPHRAALFVLCLALVAGLVMVAFPAHAEPYHARPIPFGACRTETPCLPGVTLAELYTTWSAHGWPCTRWGEYTLSCSHPWQGGGTLYLGAYATNSGVAQIYAAEEGVPASDLWAVLATFENVTHQNWHGADPKASNAWLLANWPPDNGTLSVTLGNARYERYYSALTSYAYVRVCAPGSMFSCP